LKEKLVFKRSIKWELMAVMTFLLVSLVAILTYTQITSQKHMLENELNKRIELMRENLVERGKSFTESLSQEVENDMAAYNFSEATEEIRNRVSKSKDIKYAMLMDSSGMILVHTLKADISGIKLTERDRKALKYDSLTVVEYREGEETVIEIAKPIQISTKPEAVLRLIHTLRHLDKEIENSVKQIEKDINLMILKSLTTALIFMTGCFVILFIFFARFSKPLIHLTQIARKLSKGDFSAASDIRVHSGNEVGVLAGAFIEMSAELEASYRKLEEYNRTLEQKVEERTDALNRTLEKVEEANKKVTDSIQYAHMIQSSVLPNPENIRKYISESFFIWMPKDIVGGDFIFMECFEEGMMIAVIDCTGHGVPGAFMTLIASFGLKKIVKDEGCREPAVILRRLNFMVKTTLHQDTDYALSDDGLDAALCFISDHRGDSALRAPEDHHRIPAEVGEPSTSDKKKITFAGAKMPLVYVHKGNFHVIKGDRQSIGYRRSDPNFEFTSHTMKIEKGMCFYMASDGFEDQLGENRESRFGCTSFGRRRLRELFRENSGLPFEKQQECLSQAFDQHKGDFERQDDVTVIGFRLSDFSGRGNKK